MGNCILRPSFQVVSVTLALALLCCSVASSATAVRNDRPLIAALRSDLASYVSKRRSLEHISAVSLAVSVRGKPTIVVAAGTVSSAPHSANVGPTSLFQIGSNTKAFTAALILNLEAQHKLRITDRLGKWLPQYTAWKNVTIRQLLNMTSGIPTYDNDPAFQRRWAANPYRDYSAAELIAAVYPKNGRAKFEPGWYYSNTAYILSELIIKRASGLSYADALQKYFVAPLHLRDVYYDANQLPQPIARRVVSGYFASDDADNKYLAPLFGKDTKNFTLSWAQSAGGIVATPVALVPWFRALYEGSAMPARQRIELMQLVSQKAGKPISGVTAREPRGFGLGVAQAILPAVGAAWMYEGMTLGYRVLHVWLPKSDAVIVMATNSQPRAKDNGLGSDLMMHVYQTLRAYRAL